LNGFVIDLLERGFFKAVALSSRFSVKALLNAVFGLIEVRGIFISSVSSFRARTSLVAKEVEIFHDATAWGVLLKLCHWQVSLQLALMRYGLLALTDQGNSNRERKSKGKSIIDNYSLM
jgi:hypothetical protein